MIKFLLAFCLLFASTVLSAQKSADTPGPLIYQKDAKDLISALFRGKNAPDSIAGKRSNWIILPSAAFNPSVGFAMGLITSGGKTFGNPASTTFSVINAGVYVSTAGLSTFEFKNNIFSANNTWNIQGRIEAGKTVAVDNGLGTGLKSRGDGNFTLAGIVLDDNASSFPISYMYAKISERLYRKITNNIYFGAGLSFNLYDNVEVPGRKDENSSHNFRYSLKNGYNPNQYNSNGFLINFQYNSRDQPNKAYRGIYADVILKLNQTWLGSEHAAEELKVEFRKYWGLSKKNPETVLAFWHWSCFLLDGSLPYLDLPGTGGDAYGRAGRGYVVGRFKGLSFVYDETEFRFPLTKNKLLGAVAFVNTETGDNQRGINLFKFVEPGAGAGLRLLFNKYTRSSLCIDYGRGNYGSNGLFLGLNEVF